MNRTTLLSLFAPLALVGCEKSKIDAPRPAQSAAAPAAPAAPATPAKTQTPAAQSARPQLFGKAIAKPGALPIATVLAKPDAYAGQAVVVAAKVRTVCQRKGCWMEVAPNTDKGSQGCRITFKDYGFFVPMNAAGSDARIEGTLSVKKIARAEVEHLESEGGRFAKKDPDGSAHEVRVIATGVELSRN